VKGLTDGFALLSTDFEQSSLFFLQALERKPYRHPSLAGFLDLPESDANLPPLERHEPLLQPQDRIPLSYCMFG
jgi:hypothetical protein